MCAHHWVRYCWLRHIAAMFYISLYICPTVARWHKIRAYEDEVNMVINLIEVVR
jgi:hypothetical protein